MTVSGTATASSYPLFGEHIIANALAEVEFLTASRLIASLSNKSDSSRAIERLAGPNLSFSPSLLSSSAVLPPPPELISFNRVLSASPRAHFCGLGSSSEIYGPRLAAGF